MESGTSETITPARRLGQQCGRLALFSAAFAAALLTYGELPAWAEWSADAFLWVLIAFLCLGGLCVYVLDILTFESKGGSPQAQTRTNSKQETDESNTLGKRLNRLAHRLLLPLIVVALVAAGRPILAGLYFLSLFLLAFVEVESKRLRQGVERPNVPLYQWALFQTARLTCTSLLLVLKWAVWIPFAFAIGACLSQGDIRITRRLRRRVGLSRPLAGLLCVPAYQRIWKHVLPLCFWLVGTGLALGLAFEALPVAVAMPLVPALWVIGLTVLPLLFTSFVAALFGQAHLSSKRQSFDWPCHPGPYLRALLQLVFLSALCFVDQWFLAGLYLALICWAYATAWIRTIQSAGEEHDYANPFPVSIAVLGMCLALGPFLVLASPILLPWLAWEFWSSTRMAGDLRRKFDKPGGLIYFLYSEPHQYEHFLGESGVLGAYRDKVVARNWRTCIRPAREGQGWEEFGESAEGRLLERFEISRLRHHLPFVVVIPPSPWLKGFQMSKAYRARRRDNGRALRELEERINKAANKALGIAGA